MSSTRLTSQERRTAILDAAVKLFSEKGFRGTTTRELAAAVGVSEPVLYQHFATKRDLYRALIEEKSLAAERGVPDDLGPRAEQAGSDREFLIGLAHGIIEFHEKDPAYTRLLIFSALEKHELSDMFFGRYADPFFSVLAKFFKRRMSEGAFRQIDPMLAAYTFCTMASNFGLNKVLFRRATLDRPAQAVVEGLVDVFLEGVKIPHA